MISLFIARLIILKRLLEVNLKSSERMEISTPYHILLFCDCWGMDALVSSKLRCTLLPAEQFSHLPACMILLHHATRSLRFHAH